MATPCSGTRLGGDLEVRVSSLIFRLLNPLTLGKLLSHLDNLPDYAEAAPDTFLKLIEADLQELATSGLSTCLKPVRKRIRSGAGSHERDCCGPWKVSAGSILDE